MGNENYMTKLLVAFTLFCLTSVAFAATEVSHRRYRDEVARAEYSWVDGCISNQMTVSAAKTKVKEDGITAAGTPTLSVSIASADFCDAANMEQTFWTGETTSADVQIAANLRSARVTSGSVVLRGTRFRGLDPVDLGTITVSVQVNWTSDDSMDKYAGTIVTRFPGYLEISHLTGHYRLATASGLISDGVKNWFPTNVESGFVQLYRLNKGETVLVKE